MMTHSVYFWLRPDLPEADRATFESELRKLPTITSVRSGRIGKPAPTPERPVTEKSFTYSLQLEFSSVAEHDRYQTDPAHDHFVDRCKSMWERVTVFDTEEI